MALSDVDTVGGDTSHIPASLVIHRRGRAVCRIESPPTIPARQS
jgi:hypothetical protein